VSRINIETSATSAVATPTSSNTGAGAVVSPWERQNQDTGGGYDRAKFYVKATDWRGHGEKIHIRIPPELYAQVNVMVHTESLTEYTMPADFVRDAIVHHLVTRSEMLEGGKLRETLMEAVQLVDFNEATKKLKALAQRWGELNDNINETMTILQRDEAFGQMAVMLDTFSEFAADIPEPYYTKAADAISGWRKKIPEGRTGLE
jgi:hypothetical protein